MKKPVTYGRHEALALTLIFLLPVLLWITAGFAEELAPSLRHVAYGNATFIAVGDNGTILASLDGEEWMQRASGTDTTLKGVAFGKGIFVVVGGGNTPSGSKSTILSSSDGILWQESYSKTMEWPYNVSVNAVTYANDMFVAVESTGLFLVSRDGRIWNEINTGHSVSLTGITYGNGIFVAVGSLCFPTKFGCGYIFVAQTSPDGMAWTYHEAGYVGPNIEVIYCNDTFVAVGGSMYFSADGMAWEQALPWVAPEISSIGLGSVAYGNGVFVGLGHGSYDWCPGIYTSFDGKLWTQRMQTPHPMRGVTYANGIFVAVGDDSAILTSSDGVSWSDLPWVSVTPGGFDFGNVEVFDKSASQAFTFTSTGKTGFTFGKTSIELSDGPEFYIQNDSCSFQTLAPSESCTIDIVFSPSSVGYKQAELKVPYDICPIFIILRGYGLGSDSIALLSPPGGTLVTACSSHFPLIFSWNVTEIFTDYEIQFSDYKEFSNSYNRIKVQAPTTQVTLSTYQVQQILTFPPGILYWRLVATRADGTKEASEGRRILISYPQTAENPAISPTGKRSKPTLIWQTNCNTRFKVWFGGDNTFAKKTSYAFQINNPSGSEGTMSKMLTIPQWLRIKLLVRNKTGSTIYWFVESWDEAGRYSKTDVMSFVLEE